MLIFFIYIILLKKTTNYFWSSLGEAHAMFRVVTHASHFPAPFSMLPTSAKYGMFITIWVLVANFVIYIWIHKCIDTSHTTRKTPWVPLFVVVPLTSLPPLGSLTTTAPFIVSTTLTPPRLLYSQSHMVYSLSDSLHCISNRYLKLFSVLWDSSFLFVSLAVPPCRNPTVWINLLKDTLVDSKFSKWK